MLRTARIAKRLATKKVLDDLKKALQEELPPTIDYGFLWYNENTGEALYALSDSDEQEKYDAWDKILTKIPGVKSVRGEAEISVPDEPGWIKIEKD